MLKQIDMVKCTHVLAQVNLGFYDADGHLVGEETFPQGESGALVAKLFHPQVDELAVLIDACEKQAWERLQAQGYAGRPLAGSNGSEGAIGDPGSRAPDGSLTRRSG